ncbi:MAG: hypothetical protein IT198_04040 [Acidimicrobiia bacterium]|nr:hypothetical protein [Acidimicrobiia bacterium]
MTSAVGAQPLTKAWFDDMAAAMQADPDRYRRLGMNDARVGFRVDGEDGSPEAAILLGFRDFECTSVEEVDAQRLDGPDCDYYLAADRRDWEDLIAHVVEKGRADPSHTLNTLVLADDRVHLRGATQLGMDTFYRLNASLQAFFEECAG